MTIISNSYNESLKAKPESIEFLFELYEPKDKTKDGHNVLTLALNSAPDSKYYALLSKMMIDKNHKIQSKMLTRSGSKALVNLLSSTPSPQDSVIGLSHSDFLVQSQFFEKSSVSPLVCQALNLNHYHKFNIFSSMIANESVKPSDINAIFPLLKINPSNEKRWPCKDEAEMMSIVSQYIASIFNLISILFEKKYLTQEFVEKIKEVDFTQQFSFFSNVEESYNGQNYFGSGAMVPNYGPLNESIYLFTEKHFLEMSVDMAKDKKIKKGKSSSQVNKI